MNIDTGNTGIADDGAAVGASTDVGEIDEDNEQAIFDQMAEERVVGKSMKSVIGLTPKTQDEESAGEDDGAVVATDDVAAAATVDAEAAAAKAKTEADAAAADAEKAAKDKADAAAAVEEDIEAAFMKELGDTDISPDDAKDDEKLNVKTFAEQYPSVHKRMMLTAKFIEARNKARVAADIEAMREEIAPVMIAYARDRLLDKLDGEGEGRIPGARQLANDPGFLPWLEKQPEDVKALGKTGNLANNLKLLQSFAVSKGAVPKKAASESSRTAEDRAAALEVVKSGGSGVRRPQNLQVPARTAVAGAAQEIDEDAADHIFEELAKKGK